MCEILSVVFHWWVKLSCLNDSLWIRYVFKCDLCDINNYTDIDKHTKIAQKVTRIAEKKIKIAEKNVLAIEISATAELKNNKLHCAQQLQCQQNSPNGIQFILQNGFRFVFFSIFIMQTKSNDEDD